MTEYWLHVSLGTLIPDLDPNNPDGLLAIGNAKLDDVQSSIEGFGLGVVRFANEINSLAVEASGIIDSVQDLTAAVAATGLSVLVIGPPGLPVGKTAYAGSVAAALNSGTAPVITGSTFVGSVNIMVLGPDAGTVVQRLNNIAKYLKSLEPIL